MSSRSSGIFGLGFVALQVVALVLYMSGGTPPAPSDTNKLTDYAVGNNTALLWACLLGLAAVTLGIVYFMGLREVIASGGEKGPSAGSSLFGTALVAAGLSYTGLALLTTATLDAPSRAHTGVVAGLFASGFVLFVASALPSAVAIAIAANAIRRSGVLPGWLSSVGWVVAALNVASVSTVFGGLNPAAVYSATGPAALAMGVVALMVWVAASSIAMLSAHAPSVTPARQGTLAH